MNSDSEDILIKLRHLKSALQREFPIHRIALFGSMARGEQTEESDVDILVDVDPSIGLGFVDLAECLEAALGRHVDLVSLRAIKPGMWKKIEPDLIDA